MNLDLQLTFETKASNILLSLIIIPLLYMISTFANMKHANKKMKINTR